MADDLGCIKDLLSDALPGEIFAAYVKLRDAGAVPKTEAESFLGGPEMVRELIDRGLAHAVPHTPTAPATIEPTPPDLAFLVVFAQLKDAATHDLQLLLDACGRLGEMRTLLRGAGEFSPDHQVQVIRDRKTILNLSISLVDGTSEWMSLERYSTDMPVTEDYTVAPALARQGKTRARAIYDRASVEHPEISKCMQRAVARGEQARFLEMVPVKLQITDSLVMLALTDSGSGGVLVIQNTPIVAGMRWMYEMAWDRAKPVGGCEPPDCPLTVMQRNVLRLLAQDTPEKKIQKVLDVCDSTVYRAIREIKKALGVNSIFAAGATAQRRGWIEIPEERHE
jgi:hypothetical protein